VINALEKVYGRRRLLFLTTRRICRNAVEWILCKYRWIKALTYSVAGYSVLLFMVFSYMLICLFAVFLPAVFIIFTVW